MTACQKGPRFEESVARVVEGVAESIKFPWHFVRSRMEYRLGVSDRRNEEFGA